MFKQLAFVCALALPVSAMADDKKESKADKEYEELLEKSHSTRCIQSKSLLEQLNISVYSATFSEVRLHQEARLVAVSASAAIR